MTKLTELEAKIRASVPESMELKFGCRVNRIFDGKKCQFMVLEDRSVDQVFIQSLPTGSIAYEMKKSFLMNESEQLETDRYEILGRPLQLADVLIALNNEGATVQTVISHDPKGFWIDIEDYEGNVIKTQYDLTKDYHHQSPEFYEFLHTLLI